MAYHLRFSQSRNKAPPFAQQITFLQAQHKTGVSIMCMKAFITFNKGLIQSSPAVRVWLLFMVILNLIIPALMFQHQAAQVVLITMILSMALMMMLTDRFGFSRILGLGHILWIPLCFYLFSLWPDYPSQSPLGLWLRFVTLTNLLSLIIDTVDVIRYVKGERQKM